jgi:hypothetical protein
MTCQEHEISTEIYYIQLQFSAVAAEKIVPMAGLLPFITVINLRCTLYQYIGKPPLIIQWSSSLLLSLRSIEECPQSHCYGYSFTGNKAGSWRSLGKSK